MWSTGDIHHNAYSMPSFRRVASVYTRVARGVACVTDDILSGAVCTLTTSRGIKTLTHLKRPPGLCGASGGSACRPPSASPFTLEPSSFSLFSDPPVFQLPARLPFSVPAQTTTTPIAPPTFSFPLPSLCPPAPRPSSYRISAPRLSCRSHEPTQHLVTLFSSAPTATGLILRSLSRLRSLPPPRLLSLLSLYVARKLLPAFPMTCSFSCSFLRDFSFPPDPLKRRPRSLIIAILGIICIKAN